MELPGPWQAQSSVSRLFVWAISSVIARIMGSKTYHIIYDAAQLGWFQLFIPAHESFHSHQWVVGM